MRTKQKKKSYNPFKMWGSWLGLIIGFSTFFAITESIFSVVQISMPEPYQNLFAQITHTVTLYLASPSFYLLLISGFLIGWGIHSLIRKIRK